ncbi:MAG: hypothetical protein HY033_13730 [Ignavibacteriae bacterium]|nr:hypothetical protein [Ignavibacteria bacterium]MBI3365952.1 hypothetical protein [Ignavibacteriota bacterium]
MKHTRHHFAKSARELCCFLFALTLIGCKGGSNKERDEHEGNETKSTTTASEQVNDTDSDQFGIQGGTVYGFDTDSLRRIPKGWSHDRTGNGQLGNWIVMEDTTAPSRPNVLAQISQDQTDYRFPVAVLDSSSYTDLQLSVKFKAIKGSVDQGAGLVWRYRDINNYYLVRANALEDNVNFYKVVNGNRKQIEGSDTKVSTSEWHTLVVEARGDTLECYFDGNRLFEKNDATFKGPGKIGVWTKADSYILFDDFTVKALVNGK